MKINKMENKIKKASIKFTLHGIGEYEIQSLKLATIISISEEAKKAVKPENCDNVLSLVVMASNNLKIAAKIIAIAILNDSTKVGEVYSLTRKLMRVNPEDLEKLVYAVMKQSGTEYLYRAFYIIAEMGAVTSTTESKNK